MLQMELPQNLKTIRRVGQAAYETIDLEAYSNCSDKKSSLVLDSQNNGKHE